MNGMIIAERTSTGSKAIFIEQEVLEFSRQNALTQQHLEDKARKREEAYGMLRKAENEAVKMLRKAEKAEAQRRAYNMASVKYLLTRFAVSGIMAWGMAAGLIHPFISLPLILICLCTASARIGEWRGKNRKKEAK